MTTCPACHSLVPGDGLHCATCGAPLAVTTGALVGETVLRAGPWRDLVRQCGWCGAHTRNLHAESCSSCGGPLPLLPERIRAELSLPRPEGTEPPATPRRLPNRYVRHILWQRNTFVLIGGPSLAIGGISLVQSLACLGGLGRCSGPLLVGLSGGLLFSVIGFVLLQVGLRRAGRWLNPLTSGTAIEGTLTNVFLDQGQSINERHPVQLSFRFEAADGPREGFVTSWDSLSKQRQVGERVWVVFDPSDSASCSLWPPVR